MTLTLTPRMIFMCFHVSCFVSTCGNSNVKKGNCIHIWKGKFLMWKCSFTCEISHLRKCPAHMWHFVKGVLQVSWMCIFYIFKLISSQFHSRPLSKHDWALCVQPPQKNQKWCLLEGTQRCVQSRCKVNIQSHVIDVMLIEWFYGPI